MSTISNINSMDEEAVIVVCLEINIPDTDTIYITNNNEDVVFAGNTYQWFPFEISELSNSSKGEIPQWSINISNVNRAMEQYLIEYDNYLKVNGISGNEITMTCYVVNALSADTAILTEEFILTSFSTSSEWASFVLGAKSPFTMRYPRRRLIQNFCSWKFKSDKCKYSGSTSTCDKTLTTCKALNNSGNFGGFFGISKGVRI